LLLDFIILELYYGLKEKQGLKANSNIQAAIYEFIKVLSNLFVFYLIKQ